jgi:serpin B
MKTPLTIITLILLSVTTSCSLFQQEIADFIPEKIEPNNVTASANQFGLQLFQQQLALDQEAKNSNLTPLSIQLAMSMLLNGLDGEDYEKLSEVLGYPNLDQDQINDEIYSILTQLPKVDNTTQLDLVNSVWVEDNFSIKDTFRTNIQEYLLADVFTRNFDSSTKDEINKWVQNKTRGKIDGILEEISAEEVLFLINALYFKGIWQNQFNPNATFTGKFDQTQDAEYMKYSNDEPYEMFRTDSVLAVRLGFGNGNFVMDFIQPEQEDLKSYIQNLSQEELNNLVNNMDTIDFDLNLPKFKVEYSVDLNDAFKGLGLENLFTDNVDLSKLSVQQKLFVSAIKHKTFLEINEEGGEGAAVTSVGIGLTSAPPTISINKPFMFTIRERNSGVILFIGSITEPMLD